MPSSFSAPPCPPSARLQLNSFLQFLEQDDSESLILAAANHPSLLDRALFRKSDAVVEYVLPDDAMAEQVMRTRLSLLDTSALDWRQAIAASKGLSHAELVRACEQGAQNSILAHRTDIETGALVEAIAERRASMI